MKKEPSPFHPGAIEDLHLYICIVTHFMLQYKYRGASMNQFITYIENTLHIDVHASVYGQADILPLYLRGGYELYILTILHTPCLLARPTEQSNLASLRKQSRQLKKLTGLDCVLCLEDVRAYTREKMLAEGIPFVIVGRQLYMPFLGIALSKSSGREIPQPEQLSFSTQKLLLTAIYQGWKQMTLTETAKALGISKMSITRCFDEIQALGLALIQSMGRTRCFIWNGGRRALWDMALPLLRNPVARQYRIDGREKIDDAKLGGMSALCHYSMLADNPYVTYAVTKETAKAADLTMLPVVPDGEWPDMVVQVMRYNLDYGDNAAIDPLTAILSLSASEKNDARVEISISEILKECLND